MNENRDEKLCSDFPKIFRDRHADKMKTCMCWGFCCGKGWEPLIRDLCKKLQFLSDVTGVQIIADQVKNKLGTLHFYISRDDTNAKAGIDPELVEDIAEDLCWHTLNQSAHTCEECGEYGEIRIRPYIQPLCDKCLSNMERGYGGHDHGIDDGVEEELHSGRKRSG